MNALAISTTSHLKEALEKSSFPISQTTLIGEGNADKIIKLPPPGPSRAAIYVMQMQKAQCVILNGFDREATELELSLRLPLYIHHHVEDSRVGLRWNWEEDDF